MAGTAKNSNRFDGGLRNHSFEVWDGGVPKDFDATLSNGTIVQLTKEMDDQRLEPEFSRLARDPGDPLVKDGQSAFRCFANGVWTARSNQLRIEGLVAALTGTADWGLPWFIGFTGHFSFDARGTSGKLIELLVAMRRANGTQLVYLNTKPATWSTTATGVSVKLLPHWQRYQVDVKFQFIVDDGASGGESAGKASTDSLVFAFQNVSTAAPASANPFVFDLDNLHWELQSYRHHEEL